MNFGLIRKEFWLFTAHIVCGLALALALPPVSQIWLAFMGLALLAFLNHNFATLSLRKQVFRGLGFGLGYFAFALHWIGYAFLVDAESYLWMMPFAVGGLALFMASYWAVAFILAGFVARRDTPPWLAIAFSLAIVEWARGYLFTGFPWAAPGLIADGMGPVLQTASLVGMPGLTLLILLWGMSLGAVLRKQILPVLILATLPLAFLWGAWHLSSAPKDAGDGPVIRLVQPNISQSDKWRGDNMAQIFSDLLSMSAAIGDVQPSVVIWPESAVPFLLDENKAALSEIAKMLGPDQTLLSGTLRRRIAVNGGEEYFTSIQMVGRNGEVQDSYDKWRLVPGGEYLPFAWALEPLGFRKVVDLPESFTAGEGPRSIAVPGVGLAAMLICYEAIFPHELVAEGERPRLIVNVTNDGWFGDSVGPHQHLAQVRMRAVEQGVPVVRAANTGISAIIDPWGRYVAKTDLLVRAALDAKLPASAQPPLFARWGGLVTLVIGLLIFSAMKIFRRKTLRP